MVKILCYYSINTNLVCLEAESAERWKQSCRYNFNQTNCKKVFNGTKLYWVSGLWCIQSTLILLRLKEKYYIYHKTIVVCLDCCIGIINLKIQLSISLQIIKICRAIHIKYTATQFHISFNNILKIFLMVRKISGYYFVWIQTKKILTIVRYLYLLSPFEKGFGT